MIVLLDTHPLSLIVSPKYTDKVIKCRQWLKALKKNKFLACVPAITDYELRRELIRAKKELSLICLDKFITTKGIITAPTTKQVYRKAAELWAIAHNKGEQTADEKALDGDVILAATAILVAGRGSRTIIATTNVKHLQRYYTDTKHWEDDNWISESINYQPIIIKPND